MAKSVMSKMRALRVAARQESMRRQKSKVTAKKLQRAAAGKATGGSGG